MPTPTPPRVPPTTPHDVTKEFSVWRMLITLDGPTFRRRLRALVAKAREEEQRDLQRQRFARSYK